MTPEPEEMTAAWREQIERVRALIDEIAQDSLETNLSNMLLHRGWHEKQEVSSLFLELWDRCNALTTQMEKLERERDSARENPLIRRWKEYLHRAEAAEQRVEELEAANAECERRFNLAQERGEVWHQRAEKAERALGEMAETMEQIAGPTPASSRRTLDQLTDAVKWRRGMARDALSRAALRPSEDTSDES